MEINLLIILSTDIRFLISFFFNPENYWQIEPGYIYRLVSFQGTWREWTAVDYRLRYSFSKVVSRKLMSGVQA